MARISTSRDVISGEYVFLSNSRKASRALRAFSRVPISADSALSRAFLARATASRANASSSAACTQAALSPSRVGLIFILCLLRCCVSGTLTPTMFHDGTRTPVFHGTHFATLQTICLPKHNASN